MSIRVLATTRRSSPWCEMRGVRCASPSYRSCRSATRNKPRAFVQPDYVTSTSVRPCIIMRDVNEPKSLGRYQIKGVLGKGAMGLVYDGLDPSLDRRVAIKTILTSTLDEATARQYSLRFKREVRAVARINHPNIVQVYDFGTEGDLAYIVMEYIEGKELKDRLESKEGLDLGTIFALMGELLSALDFAHEAGVIHRDIKPANVMKVRASSPKT